MIGRSRLHRPLRPVLITFVCAALLSGCTSVWDIDDITSPTAGFETVSAGTEAAIGSRSVWVQNRQQAETMAAQVSAMVKGKTIDADTAVQVALLNNKGLQAAYADIGVSAAEVWQQSLPLNPKVSLGVLGLGAPEVGLFRAVEGAVTTNLLAMATRDQRMKIAKAEFGAARLRALNATLSVATDTRRAWIEAVGAFEAVSALNQAQKAADAASALAAELGRTGAFSKAAQAREHAFFAELTGQKAEAVLAARLAKQDLARLMGLWGEDLEFYVPDALPRLPARKRNVSGIEREALAKRVDLQLARLELEATADRYGLTEATRIVSDLELVSGLERETEIEDDGSRKHILTGQLELEFEIPLFDSGKPRLRKAELAYMRAANLLAEKAVTVRSQARSAALALTASYDIARHYQNAVLPLREIIRDEALLTYNGMITNTFELLADSRARTNAALQAAQARRNYWLAEANAVAVVHGGGADSGITRTAVANGGTESPAH